MQANAEQTAMTVQEQAAQVEEASSTINQWQEAYEQLSQQLKEAQVGGKRHYPWSRPGCRLAFRTSVVRLAAEEFIDCLALKSLPACTHGSRQQKLGGLLQEAADIAAKERVQAWAELDQVKQASARTPTAQAAAAAARSADRPQDASARLREMNQQYAEAQAKLAHAQSQNQVGQIDI